MWGYVQGGMGMVSFILCDIARDSGAVVLTGIPVAHIIPGTGSSSPAASESDRHPASSPMPIRGRHSQLLGDAADQKWRARVLEIPQTGCTVKLNMALKELPSFKARPGTRMPHHLGQINTPLSKAEWQSGYEAARAGRLPDRLWCELYFQSAHDSTVAPPGIHTMSVFAQYVPHTFASGDWNTHRDEVRHLAIRSIARFCENIPEPRLTTSRC